jgi:hypothetical protein
MLHKISNFLKCNNLDELAGKDYPVIAIRGFNDDNGEIYPSLCT